MARMRYLKPGFFLNDELAEIEPLGRILFEGLWCYADREGKLEDRPKRLKIEILPYDNCNINKQLEELKKGGFIIRYSINGNNYIKIKNWDKHQSPHIKEQDSIIPEPDNNDINTVQAPDNNEAKTPLTLTVTDTDTEQSYMSIFENFRKKYPGTKRGLKTEYEYFEKLCQKNKLKISEIIKQLEIAIDYQIMERENKKSGFVPEWKHLKTWIYNRCWEEEIEINTKKEGKFANVSTPFEELPK